MTINLTLLHIHLNRKNLISFNVFFMPKRGKYYLVNELCLSNYFFLPDDKTNFIDLLFMKGDQLFFLSFTTLSILLYIYFFNNFLVVCRWEKNEWGKTKRITLKKTFLWWCWKNNGFYSKVYQFYYIIFMHQYSLHVYIRCLKLLASLFD